MHDMQDSVVAGVPPGVDTSETGRRGEMAAGRARSDTLGSAPVGEKGRNDRWQEGGWARRK